MIIYHPHRLYVVSQLGSYIYICYGYALGRAHKSQYELDTSCTATYSWPDRTRREHVLEEHTVHVFL